MKRVAFIFLLSALAVACSGQTIPGFYYYGNIVDFCAHQTYISQYYAKLSTNGKAFYDEVKDLMIAIVTRKAPIMFQNTINTYPNQVVRIVELENYWVLATIGNMTGYGQNSFDVSPGFSLCSHQNVMVSYANANIKTQEAKDLLFNLFNHFFTQVAQYSVSTYKIIRGTMVNKFTATVPAADLPFFSLISSAYGFPE